MPEGVVGSWGPDVARYAERVLHIRLDRWQRVALNRMLAYGADGQLVHRHYLISTARQNGKTALVRSLIGWALTMREGPQWARILGLAHDRKQARLPYEAVMLDLGDLARRYGRAELAVTRYLGIRSNLYGWHREYHTGSREARDSIRGETTDLGIFDEVRTQRDHATWAALQPTTTTRPEPLIAAISTAGDDRSVLLREWFDRGLRIIDGTEPMGAYGMTWYAASEAHPPDDPRSWREASPAFAEGRIAESALREAIGQSGGADTSMWRSEYLNLWSDAIDAWLPSGVWARQTLQDAPGRPPAVVLGVDVTPSWGRVTVAVAWPYEDGAYVGIAADDDIARPRPDGTAASSIAPAELVAILDRVYDGFRPAAVAVSTRSAAYPHVETWAEAHDVTVVKVDTRGLRAGSELFRSELIGGRLWHPDDPKLAEQVRDARPSAPIESGDWYLSIKESAGPIEAIRACAWAAWSAIAPKEAELPPQIFV